MNPTVTFLIGRREYTRGPMTFRQLEAVWDLIGSLGESVGVMSAAKTSLSIVAALIQDERPGVTGEELANEMMASEFRGLDNGIIEMLKISGVYAEGKVPGE